MRLLQSLCAALLAQPAERVGMRLMISVASRGPVACVAILYSCCCVLISLSCYIRAATLATATSL